MLQELRIMFQEQTEQARKMMADFKSLKNELERLKSSDKGNKRKDGRISNRMMPKPEKCPNFPKLRSGEAYPAKNKDAF